MNLSLPAPGPLTERLSSDDFDELDAILDELRGRFDETPQWEFCEGAMAALICCRRAIAPDEYFALLLGLGEDGADGEASFADEAQAQRFMFLWQRRWNEVAHALDARVEQLDDDATYQPEIMDVRGAVAALPSEEKPAMAGEALPSFAQVWALGFMYAVENWPEEWALPRDKEAAQIIDEALESIVALTEDDVDEPTISVFSDAGPPSVSAARLDAFGEAIWGAYDLREVWRQIGPRVQTARKPELPGRNDLCHCGSGKKYKKCHGVA
jgi:uncharacterized protein